MPYRPSDQQSRSTEGIQFKLQLQRIKQIFMFIYAKFAFFAVDQWRSLNKDFYGPDDLCVT